MRLRMIASAPEVVEALGGLDAVCKLTEANYKTVYHWTGRNGMFPAAKYIVMTKALRKVKATAPPSLWNMMPHRKTKTKAKR